MKKATARILSIALLVGFLFTQGAVHFLHNHSGSKSTSEKTVLSDSDALCLACSVDFTAALFFSICAAIVFAVSIETFFLLQASKPGLRFPTFQIGRAPPVIA